MGIFGQLNRPFDRGFMIRLLQIGAIGFATKAKAPVDRCPFAHVATEVRSAAWASPKRKGASTPNGEAP